MVTERMRTAAALEEAAGFATLLTEADLSRFLDAAPHPWAEGPRTLFVGVPLEQVTGRRLLPR